MRLTFKQVCEQVGGNQSTLAFQRNKFSEYIRCQGKGRNRLYDKESVEVLKITPSMYADGHSYEEILEVLEGKYGIPITNELAPADNNTTTTPQITPQDLINTVTETVVEAFKEEISRLETKIDELSQGSKERDELLLEIIRQQQRDKAKKWWQFWK